MVLGVSTRNYERALEPTPAGITSLEKSSSAASTTNGRRGLGEIRPCVAIVEPPGRKLSDERADRNGRAKLRRSPATTTAAISTE